MRGLAVFYGGVARIAKPLEIGFGNHLEGRMGSVKEEVEALLRRLPDDCTIKDIQYHLYVLEQIRLGAESAESQPTVAQEEAEARLRRWLTP